MKFATLWRELRERCANLGPDAVLVTPSSDRVFRVTAVDSEHVAIEFRDTGEARRLRRGQFEVLHERLSETSGGITMAGLPSGVEPYISVMSLAPGYEVDEATDSLRRSSAGAGVEDGVEGGKPGVAGEGGLNGTGGVAGEDGSGVGSPYLRTGWEVRTGPERVRDDALLLSDFLTRYDVGGLDALATDPLVNLYVLLSDVQRGADRFRRVVGDALLERIGPDARRHGQFGTVKRTHRVRRQVKPAEDVFGALDEREIPREWVVGIDAEKLDVVLAVTDLDEREVYDVEEQVYVQKTDVEEAAKQSRLQGLRDRLERLDTAEADDLRHEIDALEDRLDELVAPG